MEIKNQYLNILIKNVQSSSFESKPKVNFDNLQNYNYIYDMAKNIHMKSNNDNIENTLGLILNHPELKEIIINSNEEWDFLYKNGIIKECIESSIINKKTNSKKHILKIIYSNENKNKNKIKDSKNNGEKYKKLIYHILNNITPDEYINHLKNFFYQRIDVLNEFKLYLLNNIINNNDDNNKEKKNNIDKENFEENNEYIIETKNFNKILDIKFNKIKNVYDKYYEMVKIVNKKNDKKKLFINSRTQLKLKEKNDSEINNSNDYSVFERYDSNPCLFKKDKNNEFFEAQTKEEFMSGIEAFKDTLEKSIKIY